MPCSSVQALEMSRISTAPTPQEIGAIAVQYGLNFV
jgi:hypothetical protein